MDPETLLHLQRCRLFRELTPAELRALLERVSHRFLDAPQGSLVLGRGAPYDALHVLLRGSVSAEMEDQHGRVLKVETIAAPHILASGILFAPEARLPVSLRALSRVRLFVLPRAGLLACCQLHPRVLEALLRDMGSRTAFLAEKLRLTQFGSIRQKLASYLLERAGRDDRVTLSASRQALAEIFGVARPSLSRVFGELARRGWIRRQGPRSLQLDRSALERVLRSAN
jgi:CRP-like cAMP-binding protein